MNHKLEQFALDINTVTNSITHNTKIFSLAHPNSDMRYQARSEGIIILDGETLLCRVSDPKLLSKLEYHYQDISSQWFGEFENITKLIEILKQHNYSITNYVPYYTKKIPDQNVSMNDIRIIEQDEIHQFKDNPNFKECFIFEDQDPDLFGVAIEIDKEIIAMAGCNQHGKYCAEIGIQVLPEHRGNEYAAQLVNALHALLAKRRPDLLALYSTQFTHTNSIKVATKAGFVLDWVEINLKSDSEK